tara:strand:+ start:929 stop:1921 length:993 start_codon:yes stop_codon:yes gene_type:complete
MLKQFSGNSDLIFYLFVMSITFLITRFTVRWLIEKMKVKGIVGLDMNKETRPSIPEMGGISVIIGFFMGIYTEIFFFEMYGLGNEINTYILCSIVTAIGIGFVGIIDDLIGVRQSIKALLPFVFALPLGFFVSSVMLLPIVGKYDFGFMMLFLVPFAITCASNSTNMLEGFNGLSTGLCIIISICLCFMAVISNEKDGLYLLVPLLGSLLSFWFYNKYPAKIFPGDTLTMFMGCVIACAAISSNLRLEGLILLSPMILEFFFKLRGRFSAQSFATDIKEGILIYDKEIQSLTHVLMVNFKLTERGLVNVFLIIETILGLFLCILTYLEWL